VDCAGTRLIVVIASVRQLRGNTAHPGRRWIVIALQIIVAALLYFCLVPHRQQPAGGLVVLGTDAGKAGALPASEGPLLLLPEAADVPGAQRVPDLATALRQHPAATLTLVGAGLAHVTVTRCCHRMYVGRPHRSRARMRRNHRPMSLPVPVLTSRHRRVARPRRKQSCSTPPTAWSIARTLPKTAACSSAASPAPRAAACSSCACSMPTAMWWIAYRCRSRPCRPHRCACWCVPARRARVKYLRRWAADAGIRVQVQADTGAGLSVGDGAVSIDAASLARSDLLLLDERSLAALSAGQLAAVRQALRDGLGVLVRSAGAPSASARQRLRDLACRCRAMAAATPSNFPATATARSSPHDVARSPLARCRPATAKRLTAARTMLPCLRWKHWRCRRRAATHCCTIAGKAVGGWRAVGKGRIGLLPTDSWRWVLAGRDDRHGELWSGVVATLARAQGSADALWSPQPIGWAGERQALCGVQAPLQAFNKRGDAYP
jgi:hypothetical protein